MSAEAGALARQLADRDPASVAADRAEWLIDNADAYRALVAAIRGARATIWISQLALDADCIVWELHGPVARAGTTRIVDELLAASTRGVQVRVLLNASLLLDTATPLRAHLAAAGANRRRFRVRGVSRFPQLLHAKLVIVDDELAFLVGSPFANGYWDDARHAPVDARRPARELGGRPVHDLSIRIAGPAARRLGATFAEPVERRRRRPARRRSSGSSRRATSRAATMITPRRLRVVRTAPGDGPVEILPALLDGIARARSLVYLEHQYLSSRVVVDALVAALARHRALELVVVLNQNPDVTAYRGWQNARLRAAALLDHPRVGLFALWSSDTDPATGRRRLNQVFVHSKVVAIDDRWATVGSANLDGVSLHSYGHDFSSALGRRVFRDVRNFDVNIVIDADRGGAGDAGDEAAERVRELRVRLWQEHLGHALHVAAARPVHGWLPLWRSVARRNAVALGRPSRGPHHDTACIGRPFILPYSTRSTPRRQLADAGVVFAPDEMELCFDPSWLEVHVQPGLGAEHVRMSAITEPRMSERAASGRRRSASVSAIAEEFASFVGDERFPCLAGKGVVHRGDHELHVYGTLGSRPAASALAADLDPFVRRAPADGAGMRAFVAVFPERVPADELDFERRLWRQLQRLHERDDPGTPLGPGGERRSGERAVLVQLRGPRAVRRRPAPGELPARAPLQMAGARVQPPRPVRAAARGGTLRADEDAGARTRRRAPGKRSTPTSPTSASGRRPGSIPAAPPSRSGSCPFHRRDA